VALWTSVRPRLLILASTTAGAAVPPGLPGGFPDGALLHSSGSYVPLPPSRVRTGDVVWIGPPQTLDWRLPGLDEVLDRVTRQLAPRPAAGRAQPPPAPSTGGPRLARPVPAASRPSATPRKA
jgi:hypothetical protein